MIYTVLKWGKGSPEKKNYKELRLRARESDMKFGRRMPTVFLDADDTVLESSKAVIQIINQRYAIDPPKTISDLKEWNYTCIYPGMTQEEVEEIYKSQEFFDTIQVNPEFLTVYETYHCDFNFVIVTKGTKENLDRKEAFFIRHFPKMRFIGIEFGDENNSGFDKSCVDMSMGIQIDDRVDALESTNAGCKILLKNGMELEWNTPEPGNEFYIVNRWKEIGEIFKFTLSCPTWFLM